MPFDFGLFAGRWPFRRLRKGELSHRFAEAPEGGLAASLDAIFYNDPWEADAPLLAALEGTALLGAVTLDAGLPWAEGRLREAARAGARALRLYPGIHGYAPEDAAPLCRLAGELGLGVAVTARMEDARLEYLLRQKPVEPRAVKALAEKCPGTQFLLSNFYLSELCGLEGDNLWADTAGLCHGLFPFENLSFPRERLLFASFSPLQCRESALLNLPEDAAFLAENTSAFWEACYGKS